MPKRFICPLPQAWGRVYELLAEARLAKGDLSIPLPPIPLISNGWVFSDNIQKLEQWNSTIEWAGKYGFSDLIPKLREDEKFSV